MIKTAQAVFYLFFIFLYASCTSAPRMVNYYGYDLPKTEILNICKTILINLDYEIDVFAPETNVIITKMTKIRIGLRRYDYLVYIKITDRVEIHIAGERNIFGRKSESSLGRGGSFKQPQVSMPSSFQKQIFNPIKRGLKKKILD